MCLNFSPRKKSFRFYPQWCTLKGKVDLIFSLLLKSMKFTGDMRRRNKTRFSFEKIINDTQSRVNFFTKSKESSFLWCAAQISLRWSILHFYELQCIVPRCDMSILLLQKKTKKRNCFKINFILIKLKWWKKNLFFVLKFCSKLQ